MRKALFLLLCLVLPMAWAAPDATALANEVRSRQDWAGDLDKCPINLFTATGRQSYSSAVHEQCTEPASQGTCLAACKSGKGEHCYWLALPSTHI
ncbi:hypothetical protein GM658_23245 [Pseudoduganella eburnea]|uniref:Uncharacterized protein n=1 Tax=Massilia eburnea TaxID=1776165 RepID=A0A6L6QN43_9BURK|nr:hypothetical protein [Massilia eburnea]MTW13531.1 hypothetical protein [Massilia eburnea]